MCVTEVEGRESVLLRRDKVKVAIVKLERTRYVLVLQNSNFIVVYVCEIMMQVMIADLIRTSEPHATAEQQAMSIRH